MRDVLGTGLTALGAAIMLVVLLVGVHTIWWRLGRSPRRVSDADRRVHLGSRWDGAWTFAGLAGMWLVTAGQLIRPESRSWIAHSLLVTIFSVGAFVERRTTRRRGGAPHR